MRHLCSSSSGPCAYISTRALDSVMRSRSGAGATRSCDECPLGKRAAAPADHGRTAPAGRVSKIQNCWRRLTRIRLFGQSRPLDAPAEPAEKRIPKPPESPEWVEIRDKALEALAKSKDLRLLATLGTALLRTDGVPAFAETLNVASQWLETVLEPDVSSRRRGRDSPAERAELLRRSHGRRRRGSPCAARPQPSARDVQPPRHRHRDPSIVAR